MSVRTRDFDSRKVTHAQTLRMLDTDDAVNFRRAAFGPGDRVIALHLIDEHVGHFPIFTLSR